MWEKSHIFQTHPIHQLESYLSQKPVPKEKVYNKNSIKGWKEKVRRKNKWRKIANPNQKQRKFYQITNDKNQAGKRMIFLKTPVSEPQE